MLKRYLSVALSLLSTTAFAPPETVSLRIGEETLPYVRAVAPGRTDEYGEVLLSRGAFGRFRRVRVAREQWTDVVTLLDGTAARTLYLKSPLIFHSVDQDRGDPRRFSSGRKIAIPHSTVRASVEGDVLTALSFDLPGGTTPNVEYVLGRTTLREVVFDVSEVDTGYTRLFLPHVSTAGDISPLVVLSFRDGIVRALIRPELSEAVRGTRRTVRSFEVPLHGLHFVGRAEWDAWWANLQLYLFIGAEGAGGSAVRSAFPEGFVHFNVDLGANPRNAYRVSLTNQVTTPVPNPLPASLLSLYQHLTCDALVRASAGILPPRPDQN